MTREASTVRYRELYGFTHGDPRQVLKADLEGECNLVLMGLPPRKRLPLRAYHAAMISRIRVPVGYFEGISLFERMESGFNFYYTFREGETAWIYAYAQCVSTSTWSHCLLDRSLPDWARERGGNRVGRLSGFIASSAFVPRTNR